MPDQEPLAAIRAAVEIELNAYTYELPTQATVGIPWSAEKVALEVLKMRALLVDPYWIEVDSASLMCALVAQDGRMALAYDPESAEYDLIQRVADGWVSIGIRGDAVSTFLAR